MISQQSIETHVAVSSLESPQHATRKDPKIIHAIWFIGKRCNYTCSYCSPYLHDNYSPHIKLEDAVAFIDSLADFCAKQNKEIKFSISGGEPFIHPQFLEIVKHIRSKSNVMMLSVVSNGSLPYEVYKRSAEYITNLTISLHLEQPEKTVNDTVEKILKINQLGSVFFNVNLMALPGKLDQVKKIESILKENSVKHIVRKIDPPGSEFVSTVTKKEFLQKGENLQQYFENKINYKSHNNQELDDLWKEYYSAEELTYLQTSNDHTWENIRLHHEHGFVDTNTDAIKSRSLNIWKGWLCYIGIDTLNIQFDGTIWRGQCMAGKPIGKIGEGINWPTEPMVCPIKYCDCGSDMQARKAKDASQLGKIDEQH